jgi:hypothetical protein
MRKREIGIPGMIVLLLLGLIRLPDLESDQTGRIIVKITDAPFPIEMIEQASVTITGVSAKRRERYHRDPFITIFRYRHIQPA